MQPLPDATDRQEAAVVPDDAVPSALAPAAPQPRTTPGATAAGPRDPTLLGSLDGEELEDLWRIFDYIGTHWGTGPHCQIHSVDALQPILDLKTTQEPSYLTEYRETLAIFRSLRREHGEAEALSKLFSLDTSSPAHKYVLSEFITLQVIRGGFRKFGYVNYQGAMGGTFNNPAQLPYRGVPHTD